MKIVLFGAGLIGKKRGLQLGPHTLVGLHDPDGARATRLAAELKTRVFDTEEAALKEPADIAIVAVTNNQLAPVALKALAAGRNLLLEKPGAISLFELDRIADEAKARERAVKVGFNHRFHPALLKTRELVDSGALGQLLFLRARYGHGGRLGMETEWRMQPAVGGGGELLDQGVHLLDLIHSFFGPLPLRSSFVTTSFWKTAVDDNAVLTLAGADTWATFHVSCSEWKNTFSLELYGRAGKILVSGLGGSYGREQLTFYKMSPEMGPPEAQTFEYDAPDTSWALDLANLVAHLETGAKLSGDLESARYALAQVREAYRANGFTSLPCSV